MSHFGIGRHTGSSLSVSGFEDGVVVCSLEERQEWGRSGDVECREVVESLLRLNHVNS